MATVSLSTLRTRVRVLGNYENSARFTDAWLTEQVNVGLGELYEIIAKTNEGYFDVEATTTTIAANANVTLPADFLHLRGVDISINGTWCELAQIGIQERNRYQTPGQPVAYRTSAAVQSGTSQRGGLILYPTPAAVYTIRFTYEPSRAVLVADGDTVEGFNGWEDYIVTAALLRCDEREQRDLGPRMAKLQQIRDRVVTGATRRRAAEPEYLLPRRDYVSLWDGGEP